MAVAVGCGDERPRCGGVWGGTTTQRQPLAGRDPHWAIDHGRPIAAVRVGMGPPANTTQTQTIRERAKEPKRACASCRKQVDVC